MTCSYFIFVLYFNVPFCVISDDEAVDEIIL